MDNKINKDKRQIEEKYLIQTSKNKLPNTKQQKKDKTKCINGQRI